MKIDVTIKSFDDEDESVDNKISAFIENLPMWVAYMLLFIINFTSFFDTKDVKETIKS